MTERFSDFKQTDSESQRKYDMGEICCYCAQDIASPQGMPTVCTVCRGA